MDFASDEEIKHAHDILLKGCLPYDSEHLAIIKSNESSYFQACPGSGKTTTLLAKILILANRMPFNDGKGICVLTHTNVAIDEIKAKLGVRADVLFRYPNFFGTIQTFVHKFFASQALYHYYGSKMEFVDDDVYNGMMIQAYANKPFDFQLKKTFYAQKVLDFEKQKEIICNAKTDETGLKLFFNKKWIDIESNTAKAFQSLVDEIRRQGVLSYHCAYELTFKYIVEHFNDVRMISSKRFQYLFVDEMQDCDNAQMRLLDLVFENTSTIVQRFGDYNQTIFNNDTQITEQKKLQLAPKLSQTNRFGELIAKPLRTICAENNSCLTANAHINSLKPVIIVYEDPLDVLPKFVELVNAKHIEGTSGKTIAQLAKEKRITDPLHRYCIKACGWRIETETPKISIKAYFPGYERISTNDKNISSSMDSYLVKRQKWMPKDYANSIISGITKYLFLSGISNNGKRHSKTSFFAAISKKNESQLQNFKSELMSWVIRIACDESCENVKLLVKNYIDSNIVTLLDGSISKASEDFYNASSVFENKIGSIEPVNVYKGDNDVEIEVGTVHSFKGETHLATLYLETFYKSKYESERAAEQIKGIPFVSDEQIKKETLRVMYVGMSRPQYFLCFAVHQSRFENLDCAELREIWDVEQC